jgi:hypothetical protein
MLCSHTLPFYFANEITLEGKNQWRDQRNTEQLQILSIIKQVFWNTDPKVTICKAYFKLIPTNNAETDPCRGKQNSNPQATGMRLFNCMKNTKGQT